MSSNTVLNAVVEESQELHNLVAAAENIIKTMSQDEFLWKEGLTAQEHAALTFLEEALRPFKERRRSCIMNETYSEESLYGAVARGWCHDETKHLEMNVQLAEAIVQELLPIFRSLQGELLSIVSKEPRESEELDVIDCPGPPTVSSQIDKTGWIDL